MLKPLPPKGGVGWLGGLPLLFQKLVSAKRHRCVVINYPLDTVLLDKSTELREPRKSFTFIHVDGINVSSTCLFTDVTAIVTMNVSSSRCQDGGFPSRSYGVSDYGDGSERKSLLAKVRRKVIRVNISLTRSTRT